MLKRIYIIEIAIAVVVCNIVLFYENRDYKIKFFSKKEAQLRLPCVSEDSEFRVQCMSKRFERNKQISLTYKIFYKGKESEVQGEDKDSYIKIPRPKYFSFTNRCISTFSVFDFDSKYIYSSLDNPSGVIVCGKNLELIIAPSNLSKEQIEQELNSLRDLRII